MIDDKRSVDDPALGRRGASSALERYAFMVIVISALGCAWALAATTLLWLIRARSIEPASSSDWRIGFFVVVVAWLTAVIVYSVLGIIRGVRVEWSGPSASSGR